MNQRETFDRAVQLIAARTGLIPTVNAARDTFIVNVDGWIIWLILLDDGEVETGAWSIQMTHALRDDERMLRVQDARLFDMLLGELRGVTL